MTLAAQSAQAATRSAATRQIVTCIKPGGIDKPTGIAKALRARGVKTPRGSTTWYEAQVARLVA